MKERDWQRTVLEYARFRDWKAAHFDASVRVVRDGGRTRHVGDRGAAGFPDLVLVREDRLIFAELKQDSTYPSAKQREWLDLLLSAARRVGDDLLPKWEVYIWRPRDWDEVQVALW